MVNIQQIDLSDSNPFCNMGRIVEKRWYIPRNEHAKKLDLHLLIEGATVGNIAIVGLPRSGKSTLVYNEVILRQKEYWSKRKIPIRLDLAGNVNIEDNGSGLFSNLVKMTHRALEDNEALDVGLEKQANLVITAGNLWDKVRSETERFFELLHKRGFSVVAVIDEFDATRKLFASNPSCLRAFRDLCSYPSYGVTCVTISRRYLRDIEAQAHGGQSTLAGVFHEFCLPLYSDNELNYFWQRFNNHINENDKEIILKYCGCYPFLLDALGLHLWKSIENNNIYSINNCFKAAEIDFLNCFEAIMNLLDETSLFSKLIEILHGPVVSVRNEDISRLERLNLILKCTNSDGWESFSETFETYMTLRYRERSTDYELWPEYVNCIKLMRKLIIDVLQAKSDLPWDTFLINEKNDKIDEVISKCEKKKNNEMEKFSAVKKIPLIDYYDLPEISIIINTLWEKLFKQHFEKAKITKKEWNNYVNAIISIRNPACHIREKVNSRADIGIATSYCMKLQEMCEEYFKGHEDLSVEV